MNLAEVAPDNFAFPHLDVSRQSPALRKATSAGQKVYAPGAIRPIVQRFSEEVTRGKERGKCPEIKIRTSDVRVPLSIGEWQLDLANGFDEFAAVNNDPHANSRNSGIG